MTSGGDFDQGATRNALAEVIISFAAEGAPSRKRSEAGGNYLAQDHCKPRHNVWRWWLFGGIAPSHDTEDQDAPDNQIDLREYGRRLRKNAEAL